LAEVSGFFAAELTFFCCGLLLFGVLNLESDTSFIPLVAALVFDYADGP